MTTLTDDLLQTLRQVDTPTVCNAIEVAQGQRGFSAYTKGSVMHSSPADRAIVGFARTAKIAGQKPPTESQETIRARRLEYFRSMAAGPRPGIAAIEDVDFPNCVAAWWGEVHTVVHKGLGLSGALTNGVMRDLGSHEPGFPVIAGSIGPSHAFVHVREIGTPVRIFELEVNEGDLIHADRHGALVIPPDLLPVLADAIRTMQASESIILDPARKPGFDIDELEKAWMAFEKART